ncbi:MAG: TonB-dependent receptor [Chitinophagaceae bacterium]|nr:TonB-dependent receptor [Chitinophagaceae bacterium]
MTKNLTVLVFLTFSFSVFSQDSTRVSSLEEVVFTANKYPKKQSETGKVLTIVNRDQLERSGGKTVAEILNNVSGTTIVGANSNAGTNMTANIRGGSAGNVLVLINGIPVNDPSVNDNYFDLNFISTDQVERIEILKGGQSTLYGSDAVTGVINIITRKSGPAGKHLDLSAAAGSYGTFKANAGFRQTSSLSQLSLAYGVTSSNGFSSAYDSTGKNNYEKDGFVEHNVTGSWQVTLAEKLKANVFGQYSWYKTDIDATAFVDDRDYTVKTDNTSAGAGLGYDLGDGSVQFNYRYNNVSRLYLNDSADRAPDYLRVEYKGQTHYLELYGNKRWEHVELLAGVDYRHHGMSSDLLSVSAFGPYTSQIPDSLAKMSHFSSFASVILKANKIFNIELGGRLNHHSRYGNNFSYTLNPSAMINDKVKVFVNIYSAFKAPTLFELFDPTFGNLELDPEESFNIEAGAQYFVSSQFNVRGLYFYRDTKDAIEFIYTDPANFISQYQNISSSKAKGVELEAEYRNEKWNVSANYTHIHGRLTSKFDNTGFPIGKDTTINSLFRTPEDVFNLTGGVWVGKRLYAGTTLRIAGDRLEPVYAGAPVVLNNYYTVDVYGEYRIKENFRVFADFRNITDQDYFETLGYNTRGFNFMGGVRVGL